jgi:hypothetical protein
MRACEHARARACPSQHWHRVLGCQLNHPTWSLRSPSRSPPRTCLWSLCQRRNTPGQCWPIRLWGCRTPTLSTRPSAMSRSAYCCRAQPKPSTPVHACVRTCVHVYMRACMVCVPHPARVDPFCPTTPARAVPCPPHPSPTFICMCACMHACVQHVHT